MATTMLTVGAFFTFLFGCVSASFDLFIDAEQAERLLGVRTNASSASSGGVFFVRDGIVNDYAVSNSANQLVPYDMDALTFHWRSSPASRVSYAIHVIHAPSRAMDEPVVINAEAEGRVPSKERRFAVKLPCTGKVAARVDFLVQVSYAKKRFGTVNDMSFLSLFLR